MSTASAALLTLAQLLQQSPSFVPPPKMEISLQTHCVKREASAPHYTVEIARTAAEHEKGLSKRPSLPAKAGMLFWMEAAKPTVFWMKDTWIPLEILYFDDSGILLNHHTMAVEQNPAHPEVTYPSQGNTRMALEILARKPGAPPFSRRLQICFHPESLGKF